MEYRGRLQEYHRVAAMECLKFSRRALEMERMLLYAKLRVDDLSKRLEEIKRRR